MIIQIDQAKVDAAAKMSRIADLKRLLSESDHVALSDYDKEKADVIAQRQLWRNEIRSLEA